MKVCSECRKCYDDSIENCNLEDQGILVNVRQGDPTLIEGYKINSQVESDSPVEIYKATHLDSKKSVLIRIIKVDDSSAELRNELQSYVNINHPNLLHIFEFGAVKNEEVYIVSEDPEGQTLRTYLNNSKSLAELQAIKITRQIADGLEKLHSVGLLHRNINPANIYLIAIENGEQEVKLNYPDFGRIIEENIVKDANGINAKPEIFEYFSPEQFSGNEIDYKSDLYSLAIVFYEMLLGHTPYELLSPQAIKEYMFNENDVDGLDHDLRSLISYSLRESMQQRMSLRPRSTNNLVRQLRHLELVAAPSELVIKEELPITPKWTEQVSDRAKVIEKLKRASSDSIVEDFEDGTVSEVTPKYEKVALSETEHELEEVYLNKEIIDKTYDLTKKQVDYLEDSELIGESDEKPLPVNLMVASKPSNSYTFRKSHVYIAGAMVAILFGSFFLISFYSWQSVATSSEPVLTESEPTQKESEKAEIVESQPAKIDDTKQDESSFDMTSRDNFERERVEVENISSKQELKEYNKKANTKAPGRVKSVIKTQIEKQPIVEKTEEKKLFEDTIIIVGVKQNKTKDQNKKDTKKAKEKGSKVFSDVVITY